MKQLTFDDVCKDTKEVVSKIQESMPPHLVKQLVQRLIEWSHKSAPNYFDDSFIHSAYIQFHERGFLTTNQVNALIKIAKAFDIP